MQLSREALETLFDRLWPLCRSITGPGFRLSLDILSEVVPFARLRYPTGSQVFDWTVPKEWIARDAYLVDPQGRRRAEFARNNLHLLGYSVPFFGRLPLAELRPHLYSLPDQPTAIPYLTSYYAPRWGFCLADEELRSLPEGEYQVVVDTELRDGCVEIGEAVLQGETDAEVLFSTYLCHPSMANNELSGPLALASVYTALSAWPRRRYTYRFVVTAETIGTICYLSTRGAHLRDALVAGFQLTCLGDRGQLTYKLSRRGDTAADRAARLALRDAKVPHEIVPFDPAFGSDERQYCSPGFNLPVGSLMRTMYARFPEYHTSLDDKSFLSFDALAETARMYETIAAILESNQTYRNTVQYCEPQLSKRNLFRSLGGQKTSPERDIAMWWLLNLADGRNDLLAIAERSNCAAETLNEVAQSLLGAGLLETI